MQKRKAPRDLLSGRNLAIALVALAASFSFALGYFVGGLGKEKGFETVIISPERAQAPTPPPAAEDVEPMQYPPSAEAPTVVVQSPASAISNRAEAAPKIVHKEAKIASPSTGGTGGGAAGKGDIIIYSVQVGAFKKADDAEALRKKIQGKGYSASIFKSATAGDAVPYKVRVGKTPEREAADALALELKKALGIGGFVVQGK